MTMPDRTTPAKSEPSQPSPSSTELGFDPDKHLAYIIERAPEVSEEAETEWVETILRLAEGSAEFAEQCTPGYYNNEGKPGRRTRQNFFYMGGPTEFVDILEAWRADGSMRGLELC